MAGLPLTFAEPLLLIGLLGLPLLWWLLRVMPPRPSGSIFRRRGCCLKSRRRKSAVADTVAVGHAAAACRRTCHSCRRRSDLESVAGRRTRQWAARSLIDDGWASRWDARVKAADELIANAESDRRAVALVRQKPPKTSR